MEREYVNVDIELLVYWAWMSENMYSAAETLLVECVLRKPYSR